MSVAALSENESPTSAQPVLGLLGISLVVLLISAAVLNYLDRLAISTLGPDLKQAFHLTYSKWAIVNSAFSLVYIFTSLYGGAWVDRVGVRKGLLISTLVWAFAAIGHAFAGGFLSLCLWRMLLALGEGPGTAAMVKGIRRLMPPRLRDVGNGLINAGWAAGALIAPLVVEPIARRYGWRYAFVVTGGLCFLWIPFWILLSWHRAATLGPQKIHLVAGSDEKPQRINFRSFAIWATLLAIFFTVPNTAFVNTFLPLFFEKSYHLTQRQTAHLYWQPFLATDIGQILGGVMVYLLLRLSWRYLAARRLVMLIGFTAATCMAVVIHQREMNGVMIFINLSRFFFQVGYTALVAYGIESVTEGQTALMAGLMNATFSASNLVFNPLIGRMADYYQGFNQVLVMISLTPIVGLACWLILSQLHARRTRGSLPVVA